MARRFAPSVNAGSMADIAFLLLIFFLVTTTIESEYGILRKLPPPPDGPTDVFVKERNLFEVAINQKNELSVEGEIIEFKELEKATIAFLDNGGGGVCDYCKGARNKMSSDHPGKAVISFVSNRESSYEAYVAVQNELIAAYATLRDREANRLYGVSYKRMKQRINDNVSVGEKKIIHQRIMKINSMYPEKLSEAQPIH